MRRAASWTLSGVILPEDKTRGKTRPTLSRRMKSLVESQKRRILVFRNGESSEGVEIVAGRFDEVCELLLDGFLSLRMGRASKALGGRGGGAGGWQV